MRRQTTLRTVGREHPAKTELTPASSGTHELRPVMTETSSLLAMLRDMERMLEESFQRPFLGFNMMPLRHLFHDFGSMGELLPTVDIFEEGGQMVVKAELPGMKREDISVKLVDNSITISGEKKTEEKVERKDYLRLERSHGSFNRTLTLPEGIDVNKAKASFHDGLLEVRIPKAESKSTVRQIAVE